MRWYCITLIILIGVLLRVPLYHTPFWRTNDAMEYIDIAKNFANGEGYIQKIKFRLHDPTPVITNGLRTRPPATSLIYAGLLKISSDPYFLQIFNLALGIINALLIYYLTKSLFGGLLAVTNPNILITGRLVLSDQLFATFLLLAVIFRRRPFLLGITCGLLALTRLEGLIIIPLLLTYQRVSLRAFFLVTLPYFYFNFILNGSPVFSTNSIHYRVFDIRDALEGGFERQFPEALQFISQNVFWIIPKVIQTAWLNFTSLFTVGFFGPLVLVLIPAISKYWRKYLVWILFSLIILVQYSTLWSGTFERSRHFIYLYLLFLIPISDFLQTQKPKIFKIIAVIMLAIYLMFDLHRIQWAKNIDPGVGIWNPPAFEEDYNWVRQHTKPDDVIATTNVFMVNLQTGRPTVTIPTNLTSENRARFIQKYHVKYFFDPGTRDQIIPAE